MEVFVTFCVILGTLSFHEVAGLLRCIECTHIIWDAIDKQEHVNIQNSVDPSIQGFQWIKSIEQMLPARYSPACTAQNPTTCLELDQMPSNSVSDQAQSCLERNIQNQPVDPAYANFIPIKISEAVCSAFSTNADRCNFLYGSASIYLRQYEKSIKLHLYIRNCRQADLMMEDRCYERDTNLGYSEIKNFIQDSLSFFGPNVNVNHFLGRQCVCSTDTCWEFTQGSASIAVSIATMLAGLVAFFVFKG